MATHPRRKQDVAVKQYRTPRTSVAFMACAAFALVGFALVGCGSGESPESAEATAAVETLAGIDEASSAGAGPNHPEDPDQLLSKIWPTLGQPHVGDLDELARRGEVRVLTAFSLGFYFFYEGTPRGSVYWLCRELEKGLRARMGPKGKLLKVVVVPVRRDQLIPFLARGYGDVAIANLTVTPERLRSVDFSKPVNASVREVLVTGPAAPVVEDLDDLSGKPVVVTRASSYYESLVELNRRFAREGRLEVGIQIADARLEAEDLLELVNAGVFPMTVIDDHRMRLWSKIFPELVVRDEIVLRDAGAIAIAVRKNAPRLKQEMDRFAHEHRVGTLKANAINRRYSDRVGWVPPALARDPFAGFEELAALFQKYGARYNFDWVLLAAFAFQESRFDQGARSRRGAVGVMQVLPSTAGDPNVGISGIHDVENNVHAGTKYLHFLRSRYFSDPSISDFEQMLFTMAAYNAGPSRIRKLRRAAAERSLDPDLWFNNVERIAARSSPPARASFTRRWT